MQVEQCPPLPEQDPPQVVNCQREGQDAVIHVFEGALEKAADGEVAEHDHEDGNRERQ